VIGKILINDQIGAYEKPDKTLGGITLLGILQQFKALPQGTRIVNVEIVSPGGIVDEGNDIYDYLISEKKNYVINTVQVGAIASIATKLFLAGDSRIGDPRFDFMIHNPWNDPGPGDSKYQAEQLEGLLMAEEQLRKFYSKELNITEEGLAPLMDAETSLTGEQRLSLGFATQLKSAKPILAMKKEEGKGFNLREKIAALAKSVGIKAEGIKALDLNTVDGKVLSVEAPNEDSLVGAAASIDGTPAPDGDYTIAPDDMGMSDVVTVKGGLVTAVAEQPSAKLPVAIEARMTGLEKNVSLLIDSVTALLEQNKTQKAEAVNEAVVEAEKKTSALITALKTEIGTTHEPRRAAVVYASSVEKEQSVFKTIAERMKEKEEARKSKNK